MQCSRCRNEAIIFQPYSGRHFCHDHFIRDFEAKARREIRRHQMMQPGDTIGVAIDGTAGAAALLFFLETLAGCRRDVRIAALPVEGKIEDAMPTARGAGITRIARATSLEEIAAARLAEILRGDIAGCTGTKGFGPGTLPQVFPFRHIPAGEIALYASLNGIAGDETLPRPDRDPADPLLRDTATLLAAYTEAHPAAPHAILNLCGALSDIARGDQSSPSTQSPHSPKSS